MYINELEYKYRRLEDLCKELDSMESSIVTCTEITDSHIRNLHDTLDYQVLKSNTIDDYIYNVGINKVIGDILTHEVVYYCNGTYGNPTLIYTDINDTIDSIRTDLLNDIYAYWVFEGVSLALDYCEKHNRKWYSIDKRIQYLDASFNIEEFEHVEYLVANEVEGFVKVFLDYFVQFEDISKDSNLYSNRIVYAALNVCESISNSLNSEYQEGYDYYVRRILGYIISLYRQTNRICVADKRQYLKIADTQDEHINNIFGDAKNFASEFTTLYLELVQYIIDNINYYLDMDKDINTMFHTLLTITPLHKYPMQKFGDDSLGSEIKLKVKAIGSVLGFESQDIIPRELCDLKEFLYETDHYIYSCTEISQYIYKVLINCVYKTENTSYLPNPYRDFSPSLSQTDRSLIERMNRQDLIDYLNLFKDDRYKGILRSYKFIDGTDINHPIIPLLMTSVSIRKEQYRIAFDIDNFIFEDLIKIVIRMFTEIDYKSYIEYISKNKLSLTNNSLEEKEITYLVRYIYIIFQILATMELEEYIPYRDNIVTILELYADVFQDYPQIEYQIFLMGNDAVTTRYSDICTNLNECYSTIDYFKFKDERIIDDIIFYMLESYSKGNSNMLNVIAYYIQNKSLKEALNNKTTREYYIPLSIPTILSSTNVDFFNRIKYINTDADVAQLLMEHELGLI